jgi:hypothetical protein
MGLQRLQSDSSSINHLGHNEWPEYNNMFQ